MKNASRHILGIGTQLEFEQGTFIVFSIGSKRTKDGFGNETITPIISARQNTGNGTSRAVVLTGKELEDAISL